MYRALRAYRHDERKESQVQVPGSVFSECRVVKAHQHSAQGRWVQALSDTALSFVTVHLCRHLHVPHHHSNSGFSLPRVSVRATALKMLNAVGLGEWSRHAVMSLSFQNERFAIEHNSAHQRQKQPVKLIADQLVRYLGFLDEK